MENVGKFEKKRKRSEVEGAESMGRKAVENLTRFFEC